MICRSTASTTALSRPSSRRTARSRSSGPAARQPADRPRGRERGVEHPGGGVEDERLVGRGDRQVDGRPGRGRSGDSGPRYQDTVLLPGAQAVVERDVAACQGRADRRVAPLTARRRLVFGGVGRASACAPLSSSSRSTKAAVSPLVLNVQCCSTASRSVPAQVERAVGERAAVAGRGQEALQALERDQVGVALLVLLREAVADRRWRTSRAGRPGGVSPSAIGLFCTDSLADVRAQIEVAERRRDVGEQPQRDVDRLHGVGRWPGRARAPWCSVAPAK